MVEGDRAGRERRLEHAMQVAAMDVDVGGAEAGLAGGIERELVQRAPVSEARLTKASGRMPTSSSRRSSPRRRSTFMTLALRMMPAPMREKAGACS